MAELSFLEKQSLENFLEMGQGYVLDFSNRTFQEFVIDTMGIDIYDDKYDYRSGSKANRLRAFWDKEPAYKVGLLIDKLCEYWMSQIHQGVRNYNDFDETQYEKCQKIASRLKAVGPVENLEYLSPNAEDEDFTKLSKSLKDSIENNEPETALDRLHTFVIKYVRELCNKHNIDYKKNYPLHSLFGSYVKYLVNEDLIESEMTERILKSSISVLESFNDVRNNKSFAHDNDILNYHESILIFNDVSNVIRFLESIEEDGNQLEEQETEDIDDVLPF